MGEAWKGEGNTALPRQGTVTDVAHLRAVVQHILDTSESFVFDVETRSSLEDHQYLRPFIEDDVRSEMKKLVRQTEADVARVRAKVEKDYLSMLALDPVRNEVFWIGLSVAGASWAIPMGHPRGRIIKPEEVGDGTTVPPPGYRKLLKNGQESMAKARYVVPAVYGPVPKQLRQGVVFEILAPLFFSKLLKIGHNVKFDARSIAKYYDGRIPPGPYGDSMVLMHCLDENLLKYDLLSVTKLMWGGHDPYAKEGKLGALVKDVDFGAAERYVHKDVRWTWMNYWKLLRLLRRDDHKLIDMYERDMRDLEVLMHMEQEGVAIDVDRIAELKDALDRQADKLRKDMAKYTWRGFNPDSNPDKVKLLFNSKADGGLGFKPTKVSEKTGVPSVDKNVMEALAGKHPMIDLLQAWQDNQKLRVTYVEGLRSRVYRGRIHANFKLTGTVTGRLSCLAGSTIITTSRGSSTIEDYWPQEGDLVPTHEGRWMPVLGKIFNGVLPVVRVCFSDGRVLECTADHRLYGPNGWVYVRDLSVGSEVHCVHIEGVPEGHRDGVRCGSGLSGRGQADVGVHSAAVLHHVSERAVGSGVSTLAGAAQGGAEATVLALQARGEQPDVGEVWSAAPQLQGGHPYEGGVPAAEGRKTLRTGASDRDGRAPWFAAPTRRDGSTPHRRGEDEQRPGQLGAGDSCWASPASCQTVSVAAITSVGTAPVYDLSVEGDHSYTAVGLLHHNCTEPNLQNIPRSGEDEDDIGQMIRRLFIAKPGHKLVVFDYGQVELRVLAMMSKDPALVQIFEHGEDVHSATIARIRRIPLKDVTKEERQLGKTLAFAITFGAGPDKVAATAKVKVRVAEETIDGYWATFKGVTGWKAQTLRAGRTNGYVRTLSGRKRRLPELNHQSYKLKGRAERQAINAVIQGSAADICKDAMIAVHRAFKDTPMKLLLQVHDELMAEVPDDWVDECLTIMPAAMGHGTVMRGVPIEASGKAGRSWAEAK